MDENENKNTATQEPEAPETPNRYEKPKTSEELLADLKANPEPEDDKEEEENLEDKDREEDKEDSEEEEDKEEDKKTDKDTDKKVDKKTKDDDDKDDDEEEEPEELDPFEKEPEKPKDEEDEDDDLDEQTKSTIDKRVEKKVGAKLKEIDVMKRDAAFDNFISSDEGEIYKPYKDSIKAWIHDPKLQGFKFEAIANMVLGRKLIKLGADKYKAALEKSKKSKTGGSSPRRPAETTGEMPDVSGMKSEDVQSLAESVKRGTFRQ